MLKVYAMNGFLAHGYNPFDYDFCGVFLILSLAG